MKDTSVFNFADIAFHCGGQTPVHVDVGEQIRELLFKLHF